MKTITFLKERSHLYKNRLTALEIEEKNAMDRVDEIKITWVKTFHEIEDMEKAIKILEENKK